MPSPMRARAARFSAGSTVMKSAAGTGPSVLPPAKPGEANRTLSAEQAAQQRGDDDTPDSPHFADQLASWAHVRPQRVVTDWARLRPDHPTGLA